MKPGHARIVGAVVHTCMALVKCKLEVLRSGAAVVLQGVGWRVSPLEKEK